MSLIWKAKWGYVKLRPSTINNYHDLDIEYTDNGLFSIPTKLNLSAMPIEGATAIDAANMMETAMGRSDFNTIYVAPSAGNYAANWYTAVSQQLPSMCLQAPNLLKLSLSYNDDSSVIRWMVCEIPALNRALLFRDQNATGRACYIYNLNTGAYLVYGGSQSPYTWSQNYVNFIVCHGYDGNESSIMNSSNYSFVTMSQVAGITKPFIFQLNTRNQFISNFVYSLLSEYSPPDYSTNPYEPGGTSGEGGGGGNFDDESDSITKPPLPTLSSANTGFTRIYNPTLSQVQELARYLWTDDSLIQTLWNHIKSYFENPMDAIIGFNLVPVSVPDGGQQNFHLVFIDTGVSMTVAASQFVDVDCGTLTISPYYGSALDYSPYTQVSCFLPYIGNVSLDVDEVMGRTLQVSYRVDICSGSCVAYIEVDGNAIYQYSGHCAIPIPLASADFSSYINSAISTAKLAGASLLAGAGVGAAVHVENTTQETNQVVTKKTQTAKGAPRTSSIETKTQQDESSTEASFAAISPQNITNTVGQVMSSKPHIEHSGSFSGNSGYLGVRRPFVIIKRPNMCLPANYQALNGFPSMITLKLGDCTGFTRVQQVQLTGLTATNPEQAEILSLLKTGVVF